MNAIHPLLGPISGWVEAHPVLSALVIAGGVLAFGEVVHRIFRRYVLRFLEYLAEQSQTSWDETFLESGTVRRMAWGVPLLIWYLGADLIPHVPAAALLVVKRVLLATMVVVVVRTVDAALDGVDRVYRTLPRARERPIKGFLQAANIVVYLAGLILVVAILMDRSPWIFLSGLGAMTAVLLLVFRDTILSLVAGIQMTTNDLIRVGDWIEMPQFQADGDVVAISLNSITVQNWDRTLTVIPAHKFLEHSFRNWRGMQESGGRRIKRAFHVDQTTIRFLTDDEVERFGRWELLGEYIRRKRAEVEEHNRAHPVRDGEVEVPHRRRLTNVGTLRAYLIEYLKAHPGIRKDMTLLVRQLAPGPEGLPIEIYVFGGDTRWAQHEALQGDIFDHVLALVPEFGLRVFQKPSGADLHAALSSR